MYAFRETTKGRKKNLLSPWAVGTAASGALHTHRSALVHKTVSLKHQPNRTTLSMQVHSTEKERVDGLPGMQEEDPLAP